MLKTCRGAALVLLAGALTGLSILAVSPPAMADDDVLDRARDRGVLRVANTQANPPWNYIGPDGEPRGYDVDVAGEVAKRIGVPDVEFVASTYQNFIEGVRADRFDIVVSGQTITAERLRQVSFSTPYQVTGVSLFVATGSDVSGVGDLEGRTVGASAGTIQEEYIREELTNSTAKTYSNATLGLTDLAQGGVDAMLVSRFQGVFLARQNGLKVRPVGPLLQREITGMSFAQENPRLQSAVDTAVAAMISDGTLSEISQRWLGEDIVPQVQAAADNVPTVDESEQDSWWGLLERTAPMLGPGVAMTLLLGVSSFVLGSMLGALIAFARISSRRALSWTARVYVSIFRGTPLLIQILLIYFGLPQLGVRLEPVPSAILALTLFSASYLSENFRGGLIGVDRGQWEAATALSMDFRTTMRRVILPQAVRISIPGVGGRFIALMKDTSLASVITVVEITRVAESSGSATFRYLEAFVMAAFVYWLINAVLSLGQGVVERRLGRAY